MTPDREREARKWAHKHCWDIPTKGMQEREESCYQAYLAGAATRDDDWQDNLIYRLQSDRAALLSLVRKMASTFCEITGSNGYHGLTSNQGKAFEMSDSEAALFTEATKL